MKTYLKGMVKLRKKMGGPPPGYNYLCFEDYVLDRGRPYVVRELTEDEKRVVERAKKDRIFPERQCFWNSQRLALGDRTKRLIYVEGFASGLFPVHHAWCVINGAVVDLTWANMKQETPRLYYGVEFPDRKEVRKKSNDKYGLSFLDNWHDKYPLFKQPRRGS